MNIDNIIQAIHNRVEEIAREEEQTTKEFFDLISENFNEEIIDTREESPHIIEPRFIIDVFKDSIVKTNREIRDGAKIEEFVNLVILNFLIGAQKEGYSVDEIKEFMERII